MSIKILDSYVYAAIWLSQKKHKSVLLIFLQVDIVSFGVTFYEIITGGMHPYGDIPFQSQLDAMILMNKPINSISKPITKSHRANH